MTSTKDRVTTIAGLVSLTGFAVDGAIQSGMIRQDLAPVVSAAQGLALALVAWYVGKPVPTRVR